MKSYQEMTNEELLQERRFLRQSTKSTRRGGFSWICPEENLRRSSWIYPWE